MKFKLSALILSLVASSVTLWLIESPLKYPLYFFEAFLILMLFYSLLGKTAKIKFETRMNPIARLDYVFLIIAITLLVFSIFRVNTILTMICAIIVSFFLPRCILLRLLKFYAIDSWIEWLVLSFALSIGITSIIFTALLPFTAYRAVLLSAVYVGISLCPLLKDRIYKYGEKLQTYQDNHVKEYNLNNVSLLLWITVFFVFAISSLYPQMSLRPGLDIVDHFSLSRLLALAPEAYSSIYPWFHTTWANVYELSSPPMEVLQTGLAYLSIMVMFSFYIMARSYLKDFNKYAPVFATIFFFVFSGVGWLYFLNQRVMNMNTSSYYELLSDTSNRSYWDVGYGQGWIWLWYRPLTVGLTLLFVLLYLLNNHSLNKKVFVLTFSFILLTLNLVHFPETVLFVMFLLILSLLKPDTELRLREATISTFLVMLLSIVIMVTYENFGLAIVALPLPELSLLTFASVVSMFLVHMKKKLRVIFALPSGWFIMGLVVVYVWLLMTWLITAKDFSVGYVSTTLSVPWQLYPTILGLSGLFAVAASAIIIKHYPKHPVTTFIFLAVFTILFGRMITYLNINFSATGYWERRFLPIVYAATSMLAPIPVLKLFKTIPVRKNITCILLAFLILLGSTSTFLTLDLQAYYTDINSLKQEDLNIVDALSKLPADKVLLTVTSSSMSVAEFASHSWLINYYRYQLWPAKYPELPLNVLYSMNRPVSLFLRNQDMQELNKKYSSSYLASHLLSKFTPFYSDVNTSIILLPKMAQPLPDSQTMLVLPKDQDSFLWYAYDILSQANCNYTTVLLDDVTTLSKARTLIAPTEEIAIRLIQYRGFFDLKFDSLLVLNLNGYGKLAANYFSGAQLFLSLDKDSEEAACLFVGSSPINNVTSIVAPMEFEIKSRYSNGNLLILLDDDFEGWMTSGIGSGNISTPTIGLNHGNKSVGSASIEINVASGSYAYWQISKSFSKAINVDDFDFISFYWYGRGDGKNYVLNFHSTSPNNYWYYFKDTWHGWKKVLIPMHIPDGRYVLNDVFFVKVTNGNPAWSNIVKVEVRNEGSNPNLSGAFMLDGFCFESALSINVSLIMQASVEAFKLFNFDGKSWNDVFELTPGESLQTLDFTLANGIQSRFLFGEKSFLGAVATENQGASCMRISVKLPPYVGDPCFSSVKVRIVPVVPKIKVWGILGQKSSILLSRQITVLPLATERNVSSWYNGEEQIPFSIAEGLNGFQLIYINIYPLIMDVDSDNSNCGALSRIMDVIDTNSFIQKAKVKPENPVQGNLATFQKIEFKGYATIYSNSSILFENAGNELILEYGDFRISNISRVVLFGADAILKMNDGSLSQGRGFYAKIRTRRLSISSNELVIGRSLLEFRNGSLRILDISSNHATVIGDLNMLVRRPAVNIEGDCNITKLYTYALLSKSIGIFGYDAKIEGNLAFKVIFGDTFTVVDNFAYRGKIISDYKKYSYDEMEPLKRSFPLLVIMGLFCLAIFMIIKSKES